MEAVDICIFWFIRTAVAQRYNTISNDIRSDVYSVSCVSLCKCERLLLSSLLLCRFSSGWDAEQVRPQKTTSKPASDVNVKYDIKFSLAIWEWVPQLIPVNLLTCEWNFRWVFAAAIEQAFLPFSLYLCEINAQLAKRSGKKTAKCNQNSESHFICVHYFQPLITVYLLLLILSYWFAIAILWVVDSK